MSSLSPKDEHFCKLAGVAGIAFSVTCLLQHLIFMIPHWVSFTLIAIYLFSILSFSFLFAKKPQTLFLLIINSFLLFLVLVLFVLTITFSPILLLLLLYSIVITLMIINSGLTKRLQLHQQQKKEEANYWKGKI